LTNYKLTAVLANLCEDTCPNCL